MGLDRNFSSGNQYTGGLTSLYSNSNPTPSYTTGQASFKIGSLQHSSQPTAFGDNYGKARQFTKPEEDDILSKSKLFG